MADIDMATLPNGLRILTIHAKGPAFLDLPRELRDLIYKAVLIEQPLWQRRHQPGCAFLDPNANYERPVFTSLSIHLEYIVPWHDIEVCEELCRPRKGLGLRLVSKQIYHETDELFWKQNTFCYDDASMLLQDIGPQKPRSAIRNPGPARPRRRLMPRSARLKVRNLSYLLLGWDNMIVLGTGEGIIKALHRMPRLESIELPPVIWHKHVSALNGQPLSPRIQCFAATMRRIVAGPTDVPLYLHMTKHFRTPSCDRRRGHENDCLLCKIYASRIRWELFWWTDVYFHSALDSDVDVRSGRLVTRALRRSVPAHPGTVAPYRMVVQPKEGVEQEVTIYGLPILDTSGRHKLQIHALLANCRASTAALKDRRLRSAFVGGDDIEDLIPVKHTIKRINGAPTVCKSVEDAEEERVAVRQKRRDDQANEEVTQERHAACKQRRKVKGSMRQLDLQKKAARRRTSKRG
ncbi:hypothetical protein LTR86_008438 [Recurvomyces mirabilis]|nr:hypothetical protein LTR86_008438 [Recurvomyces mirabilis]